MAFFSWSLFIALLCITPFYFVWDSVFPRFFAFEPARLQEISKVSITKYPNDIEGLMRNLVVDLQDAYPNLIGDFRPNEWVFNVAGGATGAMMILHASITEYLILFGSGSGTEGHSGTHLADDHFTILAGRQTAAFLGELTPRVYYPGDQHHHPRFTSAHYTLDNSTWALELAQGFIPGMLPFGLIQMPLSIDIDSTWRTVYYTGRNTVKNLLHGKI